MLIHMFYREPNIHSFFFFLFVLLLAFFEGRGHADAYDLCMGTGLTFNVPLPFCNIALQLT